MSQRTWGVAAGVLAIALVGGCGKTTPEPKKTDGPAAGADAKTEKKEPAAAGKKEAEPAVSGNAAGAKTAPPTDEISGKAPALPPAKAPEVRMAPLDLSSADANATVIIQAPAGATVKEEFGAIIVKRGNNFQLEISNGAKDIAAIKKEIEANKVNKLKRFLVDSADALLYESVVGNRSEYHFAANVTVADKTFGAEDVKGPAYSVTDVETMLKSFKSMTPKK